MLRARVAARAQAGSDASEATAAVLERQLETQEPLGEDERRDLPAEAFNRIAVLTPHPDPQHHFIRVSDLRGARTK